MTHQNEAGTHPYGDDPLGLGPRPTSLAGRPPAAEDAPSPADDLEDSPTPPEDDPLTSGDFGRPASSGTSEDDPLTSGDFGRPGSVRTAEDDPLTSGDFGRPGSAGKAEDDPLTSGDFGRRGSSGTFRDDPLTSGDFGWPGSSGPIGDDPLTSGDFGRSGSFRAAGDDPLTSGEFGRRLAEAAASEGDSLNGGGSHRRAVHVKDDPLTSAEYRVPRSAELEALRAAAAAEEKAGAEETDEAEEPEPGAGDAEDGQDGQDAEGSAEEAAETADDLEIAEVPEAVEAAAEQPEADEPESRGRDAEFTRRLEALERLVELGDGRLEEKLLADASTLLARAGERMRLSGEHTVVTLAGGTGSGKSSLFNAICGLELSPSGMRRPMTSSAHVCVWGHDGAGPLLDWLDIDKRFRYARAGTPGRKGASGEDSLAGLVLIDLPDHDSIQAVHRAEVDRFVAVADLLVWVVDPQKYADAALHRDYIVPFAQHAAVTLIVLNQVDRLRPEEVDDCVSDLRRLLESEGLAAPHIITTSAVTEGGVDGLREVLAQAVAAQNARADRLGADLDKMAERFAELAEGGPVPVEIDERRAEALVDALTVAAGVPAVAEAMESAYELRAMDYVGWPFARWASRMRRDPLRMIRLTELREELRGAFTGPMGAQQGEVDNALHGITDGVAADVPEPWRRALRTASREHAPELPDALGEALREIVPTFNHVPRWWWLVRIWQHLLVGAAVLGTVWLVLLVVYGVLGLAESPGHLLDDTGILPWVVILVACLFGMGALTAAACRNVVALSAARHGEKITSTMREGLARVADEKVLTPVAAELSVFADFRAAVAAARR